MPDRMQILIVGTVYPVRLILPFIQRKYEKKVKRIPEINDIVFLMSAVDLAELIRIKKVRRFERNFVTFLSEIKKHWLGLKSKTKLKKYAKLSVISTLYIT